MVKWADYLISEVSYTETNTTKHISQVKVHIDNGDSVGVSSIWSRQDVMNALDLNSTFFTIIKNANKEWTKGAEVKKIWEYNNWYIKTLKDNTTKDNLENLPEF